MTPADPGLLPSRRVAQPSYTIAIVCLGNICRSPMAQVVLSAKLAEAGLQQRVTVASCGTGDWHVGEPMDRRAAATLLRRGYDPTQHRAAQFDETQMSRHDLVLVMDHSNFTDVTRVAAEAERERVLMFRSFDPGRGDGSDAPDVPDPWYGDQQGFDDVLAIIERTCDALVTRLAAAG